MTLTGIEQEVRQAIVTGAYLEAQALLEEYCICAEREEALQRASEFLHWSRAMVLAGRSQLAELIRQLPAVSSYAQPGAEDRRSTWRLEA